MRVAATLVVLALSVTAVSAQAQSLNTNFKAVNGPVTEYDYDLVTGAVSKTVSAPASAPVVIYDNTATNGFFFTPGPGVKNMDWGYLNAGGHNCVTDFSFAYATDLIGTVDINVYFSSGAADTLGFCVQGAPLAAYALTGLPGSVAGGIDSYLINVNLSSAGLCFDAPDGEIGYAFEFTDTDTGPLLIGPPNEDGVLNAFDQYDLADVCIGTFFFGGTPFASFYMSITGHESYAPVGSTCVGNGGIAPLLQLSGCACPGQTIGLDLLGADGGALAALMFDLNTGTTNLGSGCTIDIGFPSQIFLILGALPGAGAGAGSYSATAPLAVPAGITFYCQFLIQDSAVGLITSNGVTINVAP